MNNEDPKRPEKTTSHNETAVAVPVTPEKPWRSLALHPPEATTSCSQSTASLPLPRRLDFQSPDEITSSARATASLPLPEKALSAPTNSASYTEEKQNYLSKKDDGEQHDTAATAATVMGFGRYSQNTFGEVMVNHYDYVAWARKLPNPSGSLCEFVEWSRTNDAAKSLEWQGRGNESFNFGQHKGERFRDIVEKDPKYHERYLKFLRKKGEEPLPALSRYVDFVKEYKKKKPSMQRQAAKRIQERKQAPSQQRQPAKRVPSSQPRLQQAGVSPALANYVFPFGQHKGQTFEWVAYNDPSYHLRYKNMNDSPNYVLDLYIEWFDCHSPTRYEAHQRHQEYLDWLAHRQWGPTVWFYENDIDSEPIW